MNTLGDVLKGAYASDEQRARGLARGPHRTIVAIRRRRTARAAGTGTAAAVTIGALGAVWWFGPGGSFANPAEPAPSTQCTDSQLYLPANPDALGDTDFLYRAYIDLRQDSPTHGVVVVRKDGTLVRVEPGPDGSYTYLGSAIVFTDVPDGFWNQPMVMDNFEGGGGGDAWDGVSPFTQDYEWTVDVPAGAPAGVDTVQLTSSLRVAMGLGGSGYDSSFVPDGAVTDAIVTTMAGETEVSRVAYGGPSSSDTPQDVASVALRVSKLPDGGTYTITATHHAVKPALTACATPSSSRVTATPTGTPAPADTGVLPPRRRILASRKVASPTSSRARNPRSLRAASRFLRSSREASGLTSRGKWEGWSALTEVRTPWTSEMAASSREESSPKVPLGCTTSLGTTGDGPGPPQKRLLSMWPLSRSTTERSWEWPSLTTPLGRQARP